MATRIDHRAQFVPPVFVIARVVGEILAAAHARPPSRVAAVPIHRARQPVVKSDLRRPAGLAHEFFAGERIPPIVSGTIRDVLDQAVRLARRPQDAPDYFEVRQRAIPADVVNLTVAAVFQNRADAPAVIFHIEPVAHLHAVAIYGQRPVFERVGDHQRNEFLREVIRPVIVGRAGGHHRQLISEEIGARQQIRAGFGSRIRAAGIQREVFGGFERRLQAAVNFVGGDLQVACGMVAPGGLQQGEGAAQVGFEHRAGSEDAAVHVRLGGEMHDGIRLLLAENGVHQRLVADISVDEAVTRIVRDGLQILQVARVGQLIEIDDVDGPVGRQRQAGGMAGGEVCATGRQIGSRFPGNPRHTPVFDWVPDDTLDELENRDVFKGTLVFDQWLCNTDGRQTVFYRSPKTRRYRALMIDQGYCFNDGEWNFPDAPLWGLYLRRRVYEDVTGWNSFEPWLTRIEQMNPSVIERFFLDVPRGWCGYEGAEAGDLAEAQLESLYTRVVKRRERVRDLLLAVKRSSANPFPKWA